MPSWRSGRLSLRRTSSSSATEAGIPGSHGIRTRCLLATHSCPFMLSNWHISRAAAEPLHQPCSLAWACDFLHGLCKCCQVQGHIKRCTDGRATARYFVCSTLHAFAWVCLFEWHMTLRDFLYSRQARAEVITQGSDVHVTLGRCVGLHTKTTSVISSRTGLSDFLDGSSGRNTRHSILGDPTASIKCKPSLSTTLYCLSVCCWCLCKQVFGPNLLNSTSSETCTY